MNAAQKMRLKITKKTSLLRKKDSEQKEITKDKEKKEEKN